ncbi:MAG: ASCH domain-containing protein [Alphaproteobacteria bacterium]|nr:ASCH domain-containing protein [Alphaproteobacteria bacterium]MDD9920475.1 ASCH domain-containing protein [Alphaproteobacteria bacterium]
MAHHTMKLNPTSFDKIAAGTKTIELRLWDKKRQQFSAGDTVTFTRLPDKTQSLTRTIVKIVHAPTFQELLQKVNPLDCGYQPQDLDGIESGHHGIYDIYTPEDEKKYGVVGICLNHE